jgi:Mlc titration factor MtfA (ptsG expression regulator)
MHKARAQLVFHASAAGTPFVPLLIALSLIGGVALWLLAAPFVTRYRRIRLHRRPFPDPWREILRRCLPYFRLMPADLQLQLKRHIQVFLAEKRFVGCGGLVIDDDMRVSIAAQACLLQLNRPADYFPGLRQILVYPEAFIVDRQQADTIGLHRDERQVLAGESWSQGQVILSWHDARAGAADPADGRNVVIHEFAHQLDQEFGHANGAPLLRSRADYERWSTVLGAEYARLQAEAANGTDSLFSHYGATDPAEFFAVASEVFFEQSAQMAAGHPELYRELRDYFRVNPLSWS